MRLEFIECHLEIFRDQARRAVTVMKFESPPQRGTMCMW